LDGLERWDFFTKAEGAQLLAAARSPKERLLLMFALHTGALAGEQLALELGDIDFRSNLIVFRRSSTRGVVGHTKSGREARSRSPRHYTTR
jgi:integrase